MTKPRFFDMGTYGATATGDAFDISDCEKAIVTWTGTYSGSIFVEISLDGTYWATAPGFIASIVANTPGSFTIDFPAKMVRFRFARSSGTVNAQLKCLPRTSGKAAFGTLGDFAAAGNGSAVSISQFEKVVVMWAGTYGGDIGFQISADGTRWAPLVGITAPGTSAGAHVLTLDAKQLRAVCGILASGTIYARYAGLDSDR